MSASGPAERGQAENALSGALRQIFALSEAYPQLQAAENFRDLQQTLKQLEDAIQRSRAGPGATTTRSGSTTRRSARSRRTSWPTPGGAERDPASGAREFFEIEDPCLPGGGGGRSTPTWSASTDGRRSMALHLHRAPVPAGAPRRTPPPLPALHLPSPDRLSSPRGTLRLALSFRALRTGPGTRVFAGPSWTCRRKGGSTSGRGTTGTAMPSLHADQVVIPASGTGRGPRRRRRYGRQTSAASGSSRNPLQRLEELRALGAVDDAGGRRTW
jgi:hypothetical protein